MAGGFRSLAKNYGLNGVNNAKVHLQLGLCNVCACNVCVQSEAAASNAT